MTDLPSEIEVVNTYVIIENFFNKQDVSKPIWFDLIWVLLEIAFHGIVKLIKLLKKWTTQEQK
jgi:hypothetical protein